MHYVSRSFAEWLLQNKIVSHASRLFIKLNTFCIVYNCMASIFITGDGQDDGFDRRIVLQQKSSNQSVHELYPCYGYGA